MIYVTTVGRRVVLLGAFVKKTQKTPLRDIEVARARAMRRLIVYMDLHERWMTHLDYAREHEALADDFNLAEAVIRARMKAGLTQMDLAAKMQTTQSVIARLEGGASLPSTRTLKRIAEATGTKLRISFEPDPFRGEAVPAAGRAP